MTGFTNQLGLTNEYRRTTGLLAPMGRGRAGLSRGCGKATNACPTVKERPFQGRVKHL